jgi:hypothetical protein
VKLRLQPADAASQSGGIGCNLVLEFSAR